MYFSVNWISFVASVIVMLNKLSIREKMGMMKHPPFVMPKAYLLMSTLHSLHTYIKYILFRFNSLRWNVQVDILVQSFGQILGLIIDFNITIGVQSYHRSMHQHDSVLLEKFVWFQGLFLTLNLKTLNTHQWTLPYSTSLVVFGKNIYL
jgi:hypothetical protein